MLNEEKNATVLRARLCHCGWILIVPNATDMGSRLSQAAQMFYVPGKEEKQSALKFSSALFLPRPLSRDPFLIDFRQSKTAKTTRVISRQRSSNILAAWRSAGNVEQSAYTIPKTPRLFDLLSGEQSRCGLKS